MEKKTVGLCGFADSHPVVKAVYANKSLDAEWVVGPRDGVGAVETMIESGCPDILVVRKMLNWTGQINSFLAARKHNPVVIITEQLTVDMLPI